MKDIIIEFPHAGHFIGAKDCQFRRCTYVNGYIVSTVGEYVPFADRKKQSLGPSNDDFYETMVFKAMKTKKDGCPVCFYVPETFNELECRRYANPVIALDGHKAMIEKYKVSP